MDVVRKLQNSNSSYADWISFTFCTWQSSIYKPPQGLLNLNSWVPPTTSALFSPLLPQGKLFFWHKDNDGDCYVEKTSTSSEPWVRVFNLYLRQNKLEIRDVQKSEGVFTTG